MNRSLLLWCSLLVALGCTYPNSRYDLRVWDAVPQDGRGLATAVYQSTGVPLRDGNAVELVENGAIFDALEQEVRAARRSVHISTFIWRPSAPSDRLVRALEQRHPGVTCRVLVDPLGSTRFDEVRPALQAAGCEVRVFRPLTGTVASLDEVRFKARNHRKILVRDGEVAVTGGFGIHTSWLGEGLSPREWRDSNVRVRGPVVRELQQAFAEHWQEAGGGLLPTGEFPDVPAQGAARAAFVSSSGAPLITNAERLTLLTIASATRRLWIANSYFIPSTAMQDMLIQKAKAGVDVRVLCPGRVHDWKTVRSGQQSTYARLLENGVRIWEYQPSMMHAKTMLVDDQLVVVGSTNLDPLSLRVLEEGSLLVEDPRLAHALEASLTRDFRYALEIRWSWWKKRGLLERLAPLLPGVIGAYL